MSISRGTEENCELDETKPLKPTSLSGKERRFKSGAAQERGLPGSKRGEAYKKQYANYREQAEVKRMQIAQLENQTFQMQSRLQRLQAEHDDLNERACRKRLRF
ncbi:MAG: hypothetical protein H0A75_01285 [Candidatus Methanofishera endochildressiae]|uniref:BZIP domain-containing protein n=1 Tax=Candidatus Methanofishera endochildressiae TaxID=2738884 RepID=A0A7Z0SD54_9GAMM|nr:hypothetical protein [Candidatus Methanofishera endochildressiae]